MAGFWSNGPVMTALLVGAMVAAVSAVVGVFTVIRGQSFAGHSLADIGAAGGSAAYLVGANPLVGFVTVNVLGAGVMQAIGLRSARSRDVATGVVLGAALGLAALFLFWDTTATSATGAAIDVLFGSVFTVQASLLPPMALLGLAALGIVGLIYRRLLLNTVSPDLAAARGISNRTVGLLHLVAVAVAVSLSAIAIGAILSTGLLVGPAATALRLVRRMWAAVLVAVLLGTVITTLGVVLAYDSYYWSSAHRAWPVSFFVVALTLVTYVAVNTLRRRPS